MTATITNACRLCDGKTHNVLDLGWTPLANALCDEPTLNVPRYPLALARCDKCGHFQLPVRVDQKELFPPTYPYASGASASMRAHLDEVARLVAERVPAGGRVLEIGCNDGYLLGQLCNYGLGVVGVDPAASTGAVERYPIIREPWGERELPVGGVDAIVALNVFAHVADLGRSIDQCAEALKPGGFLMFEVGYFPAMVEQNVFDTIYHEHLDYHTLAALVPFFLRHDLEIYDAERIPVQGGSIRVWATLKDTFEPWNNVRKLMNEESGTLRGWGNYLQTMDRIQRHLRYWDCCDKPEAVIGYGCPAKATTLTSACGLHPHAYIDDNPLKAGKYAPDGLTPILANTEALDNFRIPDDGGRESLRFAASEGRLTVLVFAWNMLDEILPKIRNSPAQCLREARVLVPFPEPHYVE